jgi:hypothetical protein
MNVLRLFMAPLSMVLLVILCGCHEKQLRVNYELGIFPDSVINIEGLNTAYDDYNTDLEASTINSTMTAVFSSNRNSKGGEFDKVHGIIWYTFGQTTGTFRFGGEMRSDPFLDNLISAFNTTGNDFGPLRFFHSANGLEYMAVSSDVPDRGLDIIYTSYIPVYTKLPVIADPVPATAFNSPFNDAYLSLSATLDTAYFCSDRSGNFDIYMSVKPSSVSTDEWFTSATASSVVIDSLQSSYNDKCPHVFGRYMIFASDRPGGAGGYDLYCSVFRNGKWNSPVNMGAGINSSANEYRPVTGRDNFYENLFLIFSSDRDGGKGGYDLYFTGIDLPQQ